MRMNKLLKIVCGFGAIAGMVGFWGEPSWGIHPVHPDGWLTVDRALPANGEGWVPWYNNTCVYARWSNHWITHVQTTMQGSECNLLVAGTYGASAEPWRNLPSHIPPNGEGRNLGVIYRHIYHPMERGGFFLAQHPPRVVFMRGG
jgi:hypothetical protein